MSEVAPRTQAQTPGVRSSLFWSAVRNWGTRLGAALVFFILARILPKDQLGLFAAASAVIAIADVFAENGLGDAAVQRRDMDDRLYSAALYANMLLSVIVTAALMLLAPLIEQWMNAPGLTVVLIPVSLAILFNGLGYVAQGALRRQFRFRALAARALVATAVSGTVGIAMGFAGFGVWSLVTQFLLMAVINAAMLWRARPFRLQRASPLEAAPLFRFGSSVFLNRLLDYLSSRSVELFIVGTLGPVALALWVMASRLWSVLMQLVGAVTMDVALPAFSRLAGEREALIRAFMASVEITAAAGVPCFFLLSAIAPEAMVVIFGRIDPAAGEILAMLGILGAFQLLQFYNGTLLSAIGKPNMTLWIMVIKAIAVLGTLVLCYGQPLKTVGQAFVLVQIAVLPISFYIARVHTGYSVLKFILAVMPFLICSTLMWASAEFMREFIPLSASPLIRLIEISTISGLIYLSLCLALFRKRSLRVISSLYKRSL